MRLSEWRASAPHKDAASAKVSALVDPVLVAFGADPDPHAWVAWGEEPRVRYTIFVPTPAGLISCFVRVNVLGEGPRASAKLIRWSRVQLGELAIETQGGHRLLSFQVEQQVLRGADAEADRVATFALQLFAANDGRPLPELKSPARKAAVKRSGPVTGGRPEPAGRTSRAVASAKGSGR
jgi:hypothetical protein